MKLVTKQDVEAPAAFVFGVLSDFEGWERSAMRRGAEVNRTDKLRLPGPGMTWIAKFFYRGKDRVVSIRVDAMEAPEHLTLAAFSPVVEAVCRLEVLQMAARRTRLHIELDMKPKTIPARLYFQSLRLARGRVEQNMRSRAATLAAEIEERYRNQGG